MKKALKICVNKGYREFFVALQDAEEKASRSSDWHFPFSVDYYTYSFPVPSV